MVISFYVSNAPVDDQTSTMISSIYQTSTMISSKNRWQIYKCPI